GAVCPRTGFSFRYFHLDRTLHRFVTTFTNSTQLEAVRFFIINYETNDHVIRRREDLKVSTAERIVIAGHGAAVQEREQTEPAWLTLQEEIRDRLIQLKKLTELGVTGGLEDSLAEVNRKIERYNDLAPAILKGKPLV